MVFYCDNSEGGNKTYYKNLQTFWENMSVLGQSTTNRNTALKVNRIIIKKATSVDYLCQVVPFLHLNSREELSFECIDVSLGSSVVQEEGSGFLTEAVVLGVSMFGHECGLFWCIDFLSLLKKHT